MASCGVRSSARRCESCRRRPGMSCARLSRRGHAREREKLETTGVWSEVTICGTEV